MNARSSAPAPRIAAVTATPPGFNPGMIATELALIAFLRRRGWLETTAFVQTMRWSERLEHLAPAARGALLARGETGIAHRTGAEADAAIARADVVLHWADFLHLAEHVRQMQDVVDAHRAAAGLAPDPHLVERLFLLAEADEAALRRAISFGTSLLFNTQRDELDAAYATPLVRYLTLARRVWVRDALSAARVAHLRGDYRTGHFGADCALLLRREDVVGGASEPDGAASGEGDVLVFAGRDAVGRGELIALARTLAAARGRAPRWIPWGDRGAFPALGEPAIPLAHGDAAEPAVRELLAAVARASLVVTDTYHLAVLAWSFGVPAVSAFPGHTTATLADVSSGAAFNWRDKREVFFSQYDALDFLIRPEELADPSAFARRAEHVAEALRDRASIAAIAGTIRRHADRCEADLAAEIESSALSSSGAAAGRRPASGAARSPAAPSG